ncbi:hypothetical protein L9F63_000340, partial [Diploptera punctata]
RSEKVLKLTLHLPKLNVISHQDKSNSCLASAWLHVLSHTHFWSPLFASDKKNYVYSAVPL